MRQPIGSFRCFPGELQSHSSKLSSKRSAVSGQAVERELELVAKIRTGNTKIEDFLRCLIVDDLIALTLAESGFNQAFGYSPGGRLRLSGFRIEWE